jgi:signal-transduction protein with cAMP-binding, CBS, and nucleotidyltransferase domain
LAIYKIGLVVFASPEKEMLGVLTVRDIVLALHEEGQADPETKISKVMTRGVWACTPEDRLANITQVMTENKMCHLPVAKDGKVVGIISASDFLKLIPSGT